MNYNPGINYRGDQWIMEGGQQMARIAQQLVGYLIDKGNRTRAAQAEAEALIGPDNAGGAPGGGTGPTGAPPGSEGDMGTGGFNPVMPSAGGEDNGPSPAAQRGTQADALRKVIQSYAPGQKDLHQAIKGMSADQLEGMFKGYGMRQAGAEQAAKMADYQAQAQLRQQQALDDATVGNTVAEYGKYLVNNPDAAPGEAMSNALSRVPGAGGRALPKVIEALTRYEQLRSNPESLKPTYTEDPVTGARTLTYGKQALPTGYNPAKVQPTQTLVHDDDGNLVGVGITDARGHFTMHKPPAGAMKATALKDEQGNPTGYYQVGDKVVKQDALMSFLQAQKGGTGTTGLPGQGNVAAAGPLALPKTQGELVKGRQYQTAKGVATWDGTKFVK